MMSWLGLCCRSWASTGRSCWTSRPGTSVMPGRRHISRPLENYRSISTWIQMRSYLTPRSPCCNSRGIIRTTVRRYYSSCHGTNVKKIAILFRRNVDKRHLQKLNCRYSTKAAPANAPSNSKPAQVTVRKRAAPKFSDVRRLLGLAKPERWRLTGE